MIKTKDLIRNLILLSIFILLGLLLVEIFTRLYFVGFGALSPRKMNSFRPIGYTDFYLASDNNIICAELKPNISTYHNLVKIHTNNEGFRDIEHTTAKPDDTFRIVVLGDSFTMGVNVEFTDVYTSVLQDKFDQMGSNRYEILNFGGADYDTRQELEILKEKVLKFNPDLVIVGFVLNDIRESHECNYRKKSNPLFLSYVFNAVHKVWGSFVYEKGTLRNKDASPEAWKNVEEAFEGFRLVSNATGIPVVIVLFPYMENLDNKYEYSILHLKTKLLAKRYGLHFLDVLPAFRGSNHEDYWSYRIDHHPNAKAHMIFADEIFSFLMNSTLI